MWRRKTGREQIDLALDQCNINEREFNEIYDQANQTARIISGLISFR